MGYRVEYGPIDRAMRTDCCRVTGWPVLCASFFLCFLLAVTCFWAEGRALLRQILFPWDWGELEAGVLAFQSAVEAGAPGLACAEAFCREIIGETGLAIG